MQLYSSKFSKSFTPNECQLPGKVELIYPRPTSKLLPSDFSLLNIFLITIPRLQLKRDPYRGENSQLMFQTREFGRTTMSWSAILYKFTQKHLNTTTIPSENCCLQDLHRHQFAAHVKQVRQVLPALEMSNKRQALKNLQSAQTRSIQCETPLLQSEEN